MNVIKEHKKLTDKNRYALKELMLSFEECTTTINIKKDFLQSGYPFSPMEGLF